MTHDEESQRAAAKVRYRVEPDPHYHGLFMLVDGHAPTIRGGIKAIGLTAKAARDLAARYNRENH